MKANNSNDFPNPSRKSVKRVSTATLLSGVQQCNNCDGLSSILDMKPSDVHVTDHRPTPHNRPTTHHWQTTHNRPTTHHRPNAHHRPSTHHFNNENINIDNINNDNMFGNIMPTIPDIEMNFPDETNIGLHSSSDIISRRSTIVTPLGIEEKHHTAHIRREHEPPKHIANRQVERRQSHDRTRQSFFDHTSTKGNSDMHFSNMNSLFPDTPHITIHHRQSFDVHDRQPRRSHYNW